MREAESLRPRMLPTMEAALDWEGGGEGARLRDLLLCREVEVCLEVWDLALEALEWTLPSLGRRSMWSATKEEMRVLGAVLWTALGATLWVLETVLLACDTVLLAFETVLSSGLVTERLPEENWVRDGAVE